MSTISYFFYTYTLGMKKTFETMTDSQKIDYLLEKIERIDATINPPLWKKFLGWCISHWLIVLVLGGLLYSTLQMWDEIQTLIAFVHKVNDSVENVQQGFTDVKGQVNNITETLGKTVEGFKFWK